MPNGLNFIMFRNSLKAIYCFFLFISISAIAIAQSEETYNLLEVKEDLSVAKEVFYNFHPRPFQWYPKDSFDLMWQVAEASLKPSMTSAEVQDLLYPIFRKLGCGHSRVYQSQKETKRLKKAYKKGAVRKKLPFSIKSIDEKTYVNKYFLEDSLIRKGDQLLSINNIPIENIKNNLSRFVASDGLNETHFDKSIEKNFIGYYHRDMGYSDKYEINIIDSLGIERKISLDPYLVSKELSKQRKKDKKKKVDVSTKMKQPAKYTTLLKKGNYRFLRSKKDTSVVVLRIPAFSGKDGKKIYKKAYKIIEEDKSIKNLVIDLRGNGGGDASESWFLTRTLSTETFQTDISRRKELPKTTAEYMSANKITLFLVRTKMSFVGKKEKTEDFYKRNIFFPPHPKHRYEGELYVLIDGYSFSASSVVASYLKDNNRAVFIGEETGGGMHGTNAMHSPSVYLPNTEIRIRFGSWALDQIVKDGIPGRGVFPDYETKNNLEDFLENRDVEMEKVYELISKKS